MRTALSDGHIRVRRWRRDDAPALLELALESAAEIGPWMEWTDHVKQLADAEQFIHERLAQWESNEGYGFVTEDESTGRMLGGCALGKFNRRHRLCNIGYFVRTRECGRGIAVASVRLLMEFAWRDLGLHRLEILAEPANLASQRVAEKLGAVREGILHQRLWNHGQPRDAVLFYLLPTAFRA